jgi:hypothetical protein
VQVVPGLPGRLHHPQVGKEVSPPAALCEAARDNGGVGRARLPRGRIRLVNAVNFSIRF